MVIVFPTKELFNQITQEIACTPSLEDGVGHVWLWYDPDSEVNVVTPNIGADGRCAVAYPWSKVDCDWLEAYLATWPDVKLMKKLPEDWKYSQGD